MAVWDLLIGDPLFNLLLLLNWIFRGNVILALAGHLMLVQFLVTILLLPISLQQSRASQSMKGVRSELATLGGGYLDREEFYQQLVRVYKEKGINPMSGCLPSVLQSIIHIPIVLGIYQAFHRLLGISHTNLSVMAKHVYFDFLTKYLPIDLEIWHLNLAEPDSSHLIPVLIFFTFLVLDRLSNPPVAGIIAQRRLRYLFPMNSLVFAVASIWMPSGLSLLILLYRCVVFVSRKGIVEPLARQSRADRILSEFQQSSESQLTSDAS